MKSEHKSHQEIIFKGQETSANFDVVKIRFLVFWLKRTLVSVTI